jgi:hypothetical protein
MKKWALNILLFSLFCVGTLQLGVIQQVSAGGQFVDAKTLDVIGRIITTSGLAAWPRYASDPATCNANSEGAYYFNTATSKFKTCDGSTWQDREGAADLDDLGDVEAPSPNDGDVLYYDGVTDNRWETGAAAASDLDDITDVNAPTPSNGEVLAWNSTPGEWQNAATGTSTLTGLTDTVITTPADREILRFDGSDWVNEVEHDGGAYYLFPVKDPTGFSNTSNAVINADDQVRVYCWNFEYAIDIDRIIWATDTVSGTGCDYGSVGIFSLDGNTRMVDSGPVAYSSNDTTVVSDITDVYLEPGTYYVAYTATETASCTVLADDPPGGTNDGYEDLFSEMFTNGSACAGSGTAANPSVAGQLPTTLGTITFNANVYRPIVLFEGS